MKNIIFIPGGSLEFKNGEIQGDLIITGSNGKLEVVGLDMRLKAAAEHFKVEDTIIVVAGRFQERLRSYSISHSAIYAKHVLVNYGFCYDCIYAIDSCNGTTYGDMRAFALWIEQHKNLVGDAQCHLLTSQFHLVRSYAMFVDALQRTDGQIFTQYFSVEERQELLIEVEMRFKNSGDGDLYFATHILQQQIQKKGINDHNVTLLSAEKIFLSSANIELLNTAKETLFSDLTREARACEYKGFKDLMAGSYNVRPSRWNLNIMTQ